ncbi:MAG: hypothetical protein AAF581_20500 [Planctomycetota bacterium]
MLRTQLLTSLILGAFCALPCAAQKGPSYQQIEFPAADGLKITADLYAAHKSSRTPFIVLCHQAGWSRGEYREIAPKLNALGYNCLAIDQRSGGECNGVANETAARAAKAEKGTTYLDARPDIVAALKLARKKYAKGPLLAWGSSYSSALVLQIVGTEKRIADGVLSFAPGEYFTRFGKSGSYIRDGATKLKVPTLITSAKSEHAQWRQIYEAIPAQKKRSFLPETDGNHGSRALWERFSDHAAYWSAVTGFLHDNFPTTQSRKKESQKKGNKKKASSRRR